jgi:hypothetical protein
MKTSPNPDERSAEVQSTATGVRVAERCLFDSEAFQITLKNNVTLNFQRHDPEFIRYLKSVEQDPSGVVPDDFLDRIDRFLHDESSRASQTADSDSRELSRSS